MPLNIQWTLILAPPRHSNNSITSNKRQPGVTQQMLSQATSSMVSTWVGDHLGLKYRWNFIHWNRAVTVYEWSRALWHYRGGSSRQGRNSSPSGLERVYLIAVGLPAGVGVRVWAQSFIVIVIQWHPRITQPMLSSYSESSNVERD